MIVVVGSVNLDVVASVTALPRPGETVTASGLSTVHGGKGANQAVAAARLGADVSLVAALGSDSEAIMLREELVDEGVAVDRVTTIPGTRSGVALITVDIHGENSIAVYPGANGELVLTPEARAVVQEAAVVLMQFEIPMSTVLEAARLAQGTVIVNTAPARSLPTELFEHIDVLVMNEPEREIVCEQGNAEQVAVAITTMGADGAEVWTPAGTKRVPAPTVDVVDTTGAGDTFCGALAGALDRGEPIIEAVAWAVQAGALSTTALGARTAMPTYADMVEYSRE